MLKSGIRIALAVASLVFVGQFFACSKLQKALKNGDWKEQMAIANEFFEKEQFDKASILYEDIMPRTIGQPEAEEVMFKYAYCQYGMGFYILSANYFGKFHSTYRRSPKAPEAYYMFAYSQYKNTPEATLDQSNTQNAIEALQGFINQYPESEFVAQASQCINELRRRLEVKAFGKAQLYQRLKRFRAAVIAYENFRKDYPDSEFSDDAAFYELESQYELAKNSVIFKQEERYRQAIEYYLRFIDKYPDSDRRREAEKIYDSALKQIEKIKKQRQQLKN